MALFKKKQEKDYTECCELCEHATESTDGMMICDKKGKVSADGHCPGFEYDILKKKPKPPKPKFSLDE